MDFVLEIVFQKNEKEQGFFLSKRIDVFFKTIYHNVITIEEIKTR